MGLDAQAQYDGRFAVVQPPVTPGPIPIPGFVAVRLTTGEVIGVRATHPRQLAVDEGPWGNGSVAALKTTFFWYIFEHFKNRIFSQALGDASVQALQEILYGRRDIHRNFSEIFFFRLRQIFRAVDPGD